ncbi:hypothetical protein GCM10009808_14370 [Microbacterium sediminicola]|uniref:AB hydrolase-1 domain-containing protein n=1 Tax=Microbacterium sediminicola TaxID=415210 RepID=A0ABP4U5Z8_9MICO
MPVPLTLPRHIWGAADAPRRALLVHGLGSSGALMWRLGTAFAEAGWSAHAVDLRGHGTAPRALDYTIGAYAADLAACRPDAARDGDAAPWDVVVGHSLGGTSSVVAAATLPGWASRLVLLDPAISLTAQQRAEIRAGHAQALLDPSAAAVRAAHPSWHEHDVELKVLATAQASGWAVEQTTAQNPEWDVRAAALAVDVPVHIIAGDPSVYALFQGEIADTLLTRPHITMSVVTGAGHSPHRDRPDETIRHLWEALA